jgi:hypothetical protein
MTDSLNMSEDINKLKANLAKLEDIVKKATTIKGTKKNLLKEAKEYNLLPKDELKQYASDIKNFNKIAEDKILIEKAKAKIIELELEMVNSEYNNLQLEYTQIRTEIEDQINKETRK